MKKLSLVVGLLFCGLAALLAQRTITGTVVDEQNEALIGATVLVKGTSVGTVTDIDGKYSLDVTSDAGTIVFSYTGFASKEVDLGVSNVVDVTLESDVIGLEDVVVVGNICESGDIFSRSGEEIKRNLPSPEIGERLAFLDVGAYGFSMSSQYNLRPRPAEVLVHQGQSRLIRRAESFEDLTQGFVDFN